jgi:cell division protein FtsB
MSELQKAYVKLQAKHDILMEEIDDLKEKLDLEELD